MSNAAGLCDRIMSYCPYTVAFFAALGAVVLFALWVRFRDAREEADDVEA